MPDLPSIPGQPRLRDRAVDGWLLLAVRRNTPEAVVDADRIHQAEIARGRAIAQPIGLQAQWAKPFSPAPARCGAP